MARHKPRKSKGNMEPMIDIVMGTAGRFDMLEKAIEAMYHEARYNAVHFILIDNGSPMQEKVLNQHLFAYSPEKDPAGNVTWTTKRLPENMGFPSSTNEGAKLGHAPLIMFLSDDVVLAPGALDKIIRDFDQPDVGIVGIKLLFPPDSVSPQRPAGKVQHVGIALNIHADPIHPLIGWPADHPKCCVTRENTFAVTGACFTIRRNLFEKAGGWNAALYGKGTYEDMDMCMRVHAMGARVKLDAQAQATHYAGATMEKRNEPFALMENNAKWKTTWMNSGLLMWTEYEYW